MKKRYPQVNGEWWRPGRQVTRIACCDCGLAHQVYVRKVKDGWVKWRWKRDQRASGQLRRHREYDKT